MNQRTAATTLKKDIASLERQTSLSFTISTTLFFLILGTLVELLFSMLLDKISFVQALQDFRWPKLFLMAVFFLPVYYFGVLRPNRKLLQQKKLQLQNGSV